MRKKTPRITYVPSPRQPIVIGPISEILLDKDFDDIDEMVNFEPPVRCFRGGHHIHIERNDDEEVE